VPDRRTFEADSDGGGPSTPRLVIIGGAEDKTGSCTILREYVARAGGPKARIAVIPVASEEPAEAGEQYRELFTRFGVERVDVLDVRGREDARRAESVELIERASSVFFTGGSQARIVQLIGGTPLDTALHRRVEHGMLLAGTSAGAAMMSATMILEGESSSPRSALVSVGSGMEFLSGVIIDQHFGQRGRIHRLLAVVAQFPHCLGIGIDEDTALFVQGHRAQVIGNGSVTILDAGAATFNDAASVSAAEAVTLCGLTLHSLPSMRCIDLLERRPLVDEQESPS
jgi:cyanophycinase